MTECSNPTCNKKKLIDGFPVIKEGIWGLKTRNFILSSSGDIRRTISVIFLDIVNDINGFVLGNVPNEEIVKAIGSWKKVCKNYELYLVINNVAVGTFIISPVEYQCGEIIEMKGIYIEPGSNTEDTNKSVGQVMLYLEGDSTTVNLK